ncbi:hypothetical protein POUND7_019096 [Theobroma cacao]
MRFMAATRSLLHIIVNCEQFGTIFPSCAESQSQNGQQKGQHHQKFEVIQRLQADAAMPRLSRPLPEAVLDGFIWSTDEARYIFPVQNKPSFMPFLEHDHHVTKCLFCSVLPAYIQSQPQQRQPRFRTECQIQNVNAVEPKYRYRSEAGVTEFRDQNENQFQCARGIRGAVFPGCPETYQSGSEQSQSQLDRQQSYNDQHQRIRQIKEGEILAQVFSIDSKLVRKLQNQKDNRGAIVKCQLEFDVVSPQSEEEEQRQEGNEEEEEGQEQEQEQERGQRREKREQGRQGRKVEEVPTLTGNILHNEVNNPSLADIFNPRGGRISTVNSYSLPILQYLQLSAEKGVLYRNAFYAPYWNVNAHSIVHITRGNGRFQIVRENGDTVFDDQVEEGQMIVVPQNFAVLKKAGIQGLDWNGLRC